MDSEDEAQMALDAFASGITKMSLTESMYSFFCMQFDYIDKKGEGLVIQLEPDMGIVGNSGSVIFNFETDKWEVGPGRVQSS